MIITVLDTETCNLEAGVVEIAGVVIEDDIIAGWHQSLVNPEGIPIDIEAMAIHHITEEMVAGERPLVEVLESYRGADFIAAHNAPFDRSFMPEDDSIRDLPWIDTCQCARHLFPLAPGYSNQVLRYYLGLDVSDMPAEAGNLVHRALFDAWCSAKILMRMRAMGLSPEELVEMSTQPAMLITMKFGKHRGKTWEFVARYDPGYLKWVSMNRDDINEVHTAKFWLQQPTRRLL